MNQEAQEYYNIASWTKDKVNYNQNLIRINIDRFYMGKYGFVIWDIT